MEILRQNGSDDDLTEILEEVTRGIPSATRPKTAQCFNAACSLTEASENRRFAVCAGCQQARYCSRECHVANWKKHKRVCRAASMVIMQHGAVRRLQETKEKLAKDLRQVYEIDGVADLLSKPDTLKKLANSNLAETMCLGPEDRSKFLPVKEAGGGGGGGGPPPEGSGFFRALWNLAKKIFSAAKACVRWCAAQVKQAINWIYDRLPAIAATTKTTELVDDTDFLDARVSVILVVLACFWVLLNCHVFF